MLTALGYDKTEKQIGGGGGIYNLEKSKNKICPETVMFVYIIIICADTPTFAAGGCDWQNSELTKGTAHNEKLSE